MLDIFKPSIPPSKEPIMPMFWGCCHLWTWHYCCLMWGVETRMLAASNPGWGRHSSSSVPISRPNEYCDGQDTAQPPQWGGGGEWMRIFREKYCQLMWTMSHKSPAISSCVSVWSEEAPSQLEQVCVCGRHVSIATLCSSIIGEGRRHLLACIKRQDFCIWL